jgi:hypothetical protein
MNTQKDLEKYAPYIERAGIMRDLRVIDAAYGPRALRAIALSAAGLESLDDYERLREAEDRAAALRVRLAGLVLPGAVDT